MTSPHLLACLFLIGLASLSSVSAIKCFSCYTEDGPDPCSKTLIMKDCPAGWESCFRSLNPDGTEFRRGCSQEGAIAGGEHPHGGGSKEVDKYPKTGKGGKVTMYICDGELCNHDGSEPSEVDLAAPDDHEGIDHEGHEAHEGGEGGEGGDKKGDDDGHEHGDEHEHGEAHAKPIPPEELEKIITLKCQSCKITGSSNETCDPSSVVDCDKEFQSCFQEFRNDHETYRVRGCTSEKLEGCHPQIDVGDKIMLTKCYCQEDLCNGDDQELVHAKDKPVRPGTAGRDGLKPRKPKARKGKADEESGAGTPMDHGHQRLGLLMAGFGLVTITSALLAYLQ